MLLVVVVMLQEHKISAKKPFTATSSLLRQIETHHASVQINDTVIADLLGTLAKHGQESILVGLKGLRD